LDPGRLCRALRPSTGNSLARHPLWALSGLLAAFSAVGLGWLIRHLIPNVLSVPLMLVPGLAAPLHAAILVEWVYNAAFRRQRPRAVYWCDFLLFRYAYSSE
jgi:hypothetical protein